MTTREAPIIGCNRHPEGGHACRCQPDEEQFHPRAKTMFCWITASVRRAWRMSQGVSADHRTSARYRQSRSRRLSPSPPWRCRWWRRPWPGRRSPHHPPWRRSRTGGSPRPGGPCPRAAVRPSHRRLSNGLSRPLIVAAQHDDLGDAEAFEGVHHGRATGRTLSAILIRPQMCPALPMATSECPASSRRVAMAWKAALSTPSSSIKRWLPIQKRVPSMVPSAPFPVTFTAGVEVGRGQRRAPGWHVPGDARCALPAPRHGRAGHARYDRRGGGLPAPSGAHGSACPSCRKR